MYADHHHHGGTAIDIYELYDDGHIRVRDVHAGGYLDGDEQDAAIDRLLDHIDFARIARAVNRRGYAVDVTEFDPDDDPAVHDPRDHSLELLDCLLTFGPELGFDRYPVTWGDLRIARDRWVAAHP